MEQTMSSDSEAVLRWALSRRKAGREVALATVVRTWGSSPRPAGSQLAVDRDGAFVGSVSGGCVESAVMEVAQEVMASGRARQLEFGVSNDDAWDVGLACGGRLQVYVEALTTDDDDGDALDQLLSVRDQQRPAVLATWLDQGKRRVIEAAADDADQALLEAARRALTRDQSEQLDSEQGPILLQPYNPPLRMLIIGAVHIAQALCEMARLNGFEPTVIDPRRAFATAERFAGARLLCAWPQDALDELALDARCAVVTLTHDPKLDEPALTAALDSDAFYVGALGSRRTHAARLQRLLEAGLGEAQLQRIHGPVGLAIGARSAAEIATSVMAQVIQRLRTGDT